MKIMLTGAHGQLGFELQCCLQTLGEIHAFDRAALDLADLERLGETVRTLRPDLIINAAAYTAVERAEDEPQLARLINAEAPGVLAQQAREIGAPIVHFSTDYVFDGYKRDSYVETDLAWPLNVYGQTKLRGEREVASAGGDYVILRTSWLYGMRGHNFLRTMLRLAASQDSVRVVDDQIGAPTWARTVAQCTADMLVQARLGGPQWWQAQRGIYHLAARGQTSWAGFAQAIMTLSGSNCRVEPIASSAYPGRVRRPANSRLNSNKFAQRFCHLPEWEQALRLCLS